MKRQSPKQRKQTGIIFIVLALFMLSLCVYTLLSNQITSKFIYIQSGLALMWLIQGVYFVSTLKEYEEKYFPVRKFADPLSEKEFQHEDNSEQLQKEILKEAQKFTLEEYKSIRLRLLIMLAALTVLHFVVLDYGLWFLIYIYTLSLISLGVNKLRLTHKGEEILKKITFVSSITLMIISPGLGLLAYILFNEIVSSVIIYISTMLIGLFMLVRLRKSLKET